MRKEKNDEPTDGNPYAHLDKTAVVQEARAFNETPINAKKCTAILCKLLYLFQHGEIISRTEATDTFFAITKLWQSKDPVVRRLVYLAIKELCLIANDVIIVTSSLMKDMTGSEDNYRAAAIRALCRITDGSMLQTIERYMKQAIVDKVPAVASAALVSSLHFLRKNPDFVRRWVNEVQEAASSDNHMVQFHALGLLYHIRSNDRLAVSKLVHKFTKTPLRSPHAICYLIRIAAKLIEDDESGDTSAFSYLESCLRHKNEMVVYEAAGAIVKLPNITSGELASAVSCLQLFCASPKPSLRFAAVRTLNRISINYPQAVISCNVDLETLITDQNRSIATLAITTLLKTGAEASVERLMKQISSFVSEIGDEFKIVVIEAIRSLCSRYPRKHATMMSFLAQMLRDEGGYEYKKAIVDTIIAIIEDNPEAKEEGLSHLCEFIEDCEHANLATRVLHLLGRQGPQTQNPQRYIRFIYNRIILESTQVRAAAVTALAKFGAQCPGLRQSIVVLLKRSLFDTDDEVRDRATFYLAVLRSEKESLMADFVLNAVQVSVTGLERQTEQYLATGDYSEAFDIKQVPVAAEPITATETKKKPVLSDEPLPKSEEKKEAAIDAYAEKLVSIPALSKLGPLFKSSSPVELTESVTEYTVSLIKHIFPHHVVFQFNCKNTLQDQLLTNVRVVLEAEDDAEWEILDTVTLDRLPYNEVGQTYIVLKDTGLQASFSASLNFSVTDVDPATGEPESDEFYDDSYQLEDVEVAVGDFFAPLRKANFGAAWDAANSEKAKEQTYKLPSEKSLPESVREIAKFLSLAANDGTDRVSEDKSSHKLLLSGRFRNGSEVVAKIAFAVDPSDQSVTVNFDVRGDDQVVNEWVADSIQ